MPETTKNDLLTAVVSPRSVGGTSLFDAEDPIDSENVNAYCSAPSETQCAVRELRKLGFTILEQNELTFTIQGTRKLFQDVFGVRLKKESQDQGYDKRVDHYTVVGDEKAQILEPPPQLRQWIEGIALSIPPTFFENALAPIAPIHEDAYFYYSVPDGISVSLRSARAHRTGATGSGVRVAMPDTGFFRHRFYRERGYRVESVVLASGATDPNHDSVGHGTGEAANVFATAPDARLIPIKMGDPIDSIKKAVARGAKVITNSWGYDIDSGNASWAGLHPYYKALAAEIQLAIKKGVVVCFAAGNGHHAFPASMPQVIAVGGVHLNYEDSRFEASGYASSFVSKIYPGRRVPDVCGLTGDRATVDGGVRAPSIMLPVEPGSSLDTISPSTGSGGDGWGIFSGTSAACPQVAGVVAMMLAQNSKLTPKKVKDILIKTARDVSDGQSAMGHNATYGPDLATGAGLVDAKWAYIYSLGNVASAFFDASAEDQIDQINRGDLPRLPLGFEDFIETLRSG